ncbi:MAG: hypothetical protein ACLTDR_06405 [Adlercreutzia equolifaciens]
MGGIAGRMTLSGAIENCENSASVTAARRSGQRRRYRRAPPTTPHPRAACPSRDAITAGASPAPTASAASPASARPSCRIARTAAPLPVRGYSVGGIVGEQKNYGAVTGCANFRIGFHEQRRRLRHQGHRGMGPYDGAAPAYAASAPITVTGCANSASVQGGSCAGGIVGTFYNAGTVSGNTNTAASITSSSFAGGIVGNLQNADISSLPSTIPEGILVENNVSTTPLNAITAPLKGPYAYNNTPSDFTVRDNGSAWVAQAGATRYATLAGAFATAPDHSTIKLVSSVSEQPTLSRFRRPRAHAGSGRLQPLLRHGRRHCPFGMEP